MKKSELTPLERSEEISKFAIDFLQAVQRGIVYSTEDDGYALTSHLRQNYHIPTSTAPITLAGAVDILRHQMKRNGESPTPEIVRNLEAAVQNITLAQTFINSGQTRMPADHAQHVAQNIESSLPDMTRLVNGLKQTSVPVTAF